MAIAKIKKLPTEQKNEVIKFVKFLEFKLDKTDQKERELDDINEQTWLNAIASNPSFAFLNDPEEDIYTQENGKPVNYES
jgi:hypothetical protein